MSFLTCISERPARYFFIFLATLSLLTFSCSKSTDPGTKKPPDNGPIGILLEGADTDSALSGTSNHGPFAVPEDEWDGDFVTTRLEAVINPGATVGEVNTALNNVGAKISCMRAGLMFTELVVPALTSVGQAEVVCSTLVASGGFLSAYPCFDPTAGNDGDVAPGFPANIRITPLEEAKFPAAWNLRERVAALHSPVTIMVADDFGRLVAHPEIPAQTFVAGSATADTLFDSLGNVEGNHGFAVAGTIGARYDDIGSTGAFADTANLLRLPCYGMGGLGSWMAILTDLASRLPYSGKFILNTSWGYSGDFTRFPKRQRIEHAFYWRSLVALRQGDFLHTQSSGNSGLFSPAQPNADYNSPFTLTARFDNPFQMLQGTEVTPADSTALTTLFAQAIVNGGTYATKLHNVITVGSSDWSGNLSSFSSGPADVRMIGENVTLPCLMGDGVCGPGTDVAWQGSYEGTSFAAPQVAALAGWLWALSPSLSVDETKATIINCYNGKWIDAYKAVLSVDHSMASADVRLTLLDVADGSGNMGSNNKFDEKDLQMILDSILYYEASRGAVSPLWTRDHSRFDLNGDGFTGDTMLTSSTAPFDLDINTPPAYSTVSVTPCDAPSPNDTTLDERAVTDRDILSYYAFTALYTGNDSLRNELLGVSCTPFWTGHDSTFIYVYSGVPALGIHNADSSFSGSLSTDLDEYRDSVQSYIGIWCKGPGGFRFTSDAESASNLGASGGSTSLSVGGAAFLSSSATATPPTSTSSGCQFHVSSGAGAESSVDFALAGGSSGMPFTLVVDGTVLPTNQILTPRARCIVELSIVDTTVLASVAATQTRLLLPKFDSDVNALPYVMSDLLFPLAEHHVYRLKLTTSVATAATTLIDEGPIEAEVDVSITLLVGP
ncbi:MAG: S8 family serine peptidase [bacterium]|nr:S8 family serine peptidase [bacterium]